MEAKETEDRRRRKLAKVLARLRPQRRGAPKKKKSAQRVREKLTVKRIEKIIKKPGRYGDEHRGLYLQVRSRTNASWLYRYYINGRERWMGLGSLAITTRDEAVAKAKAAGAMVKRDIVTEIVDGKPRKTIIPGRDPARSSQPESAGLLISRTRQQLSADCAIASRAVGGRLSEFAEIARHHSKSAQQHSTNLFILSPCAATST